MASNLPLARKYRPRNFQTLVGQEITVQALTNALDNQRLHHAYLFSGTRGVGKTTLARILAKSLNCEKGISSSPCGTCSICVAVDEGRFVDLIEVDAASRTKVEDTRELLDNVQYLPTQGRFKVYLIDEVHMLSGHSFNALLKTLEEPPLHVKFLLATTDPQKLPVTVLSRCLQFHLRRLPIDKIVSHLSQILLQENAVFEKEALQILGLAADGSLRDALSLLDQSLSFGNGKVETIAVRNMLGLASEKHLLLLLSLIIQGSVKEILQAVNQLLEVAVDFSEILSGLITMLHQIAFAQFCPETLDEIVHGRSELLKFAKALTPEEIQLYYQIALQGSRDLPYAPNPKIGFEMTLLRMLAFQPVRLTKEPMAVSASPVTTTEPAAVSASPIRAREPGDGRVAPVVIPQVAPVAKPQMVDVVTQSVDTKPEMTNTVANVAGEQSVDWNQLVTILPLTGLSKALAEHCTLTSMNADVIHLELDSAQKPLLSKRHEDRLREVLCQHFAKTIRLVITFGKTALETPAISNQRRIAEKQRISREKVEADPTIQELIKTFDAKVEQITFKEE